MGDTYRESALTRGRPSGPCGCEDCDCELHTYPDDECCIWCRNGDHGGDDGSEPQFDVCPKCNEPFNHWVPNGYRDAWPKDADFEVCTTEDSERMFVHVQNLHKDRAAGEDDDGE